jgi:hypothetical protein
MKRALFVFLSVSSLLACRSKHTLFEKVSSSHSGITFNNAIVETDTINPIDVVNIYNGGGVGIGDFNNDGSPDIYFGGNQVSSRLYLNKGNFRFADVTAAAGVEGLGRWARGISVVDINNDGWMDIYICNTIYRDSLQRRNILYINQGVDKNGIPHFKDMASEYGLDSHGQSTMASFFDYDNDGDLDMYLTVNEASNGESPTTFLRRHEPNAKPSRGKLYRNDMDSVSGHPVYHDVSAAAGISFEGFGHAATICDINNDGWKDIYVSNDFLSSNLLYINNHDGTFTNRAKDYFKHTSYNSMGQDIVDINNDGLPDVIELDMNPEDNYRKKMMLASNSYLTYQNFDIYGYQYQYVRNTLQLNQGPQVGENDSVGLPAFSEIAFMSGIAQTDWSWSPLVIDLDNDGYRDIVVTNGFPRDVSDHDFMAYRDEHKGLVGKAQLLDQIPVVKLHSYAFRNTDGLLFSDESFNWGLSQPAFSNGVAYADFDNDGAMDMVVNTINDEAFLYRNTSRAGDPAGTHYLQVKFKGGGRNVNGLGATASIYYDHGHMQTYENNPYRGYLSSMEGLAHFGLGATAVVDSVVVKWGNGKMQVIRDVKADQLLTVDVSNAFERYFLSLPAVAAGALFKEVTHGAGVSYRHHDYDFIDFDIQHLLPHKLSEYCPALAVADIDGNGSDDLVIGGNGAYPAHLLLQRPDGRFLQKDSLPGMGVRSKAKDEGILVFDANGDGFPDIYMASGGYEPAAGNAVYQDRLYINDGKGGFRLDSLALPVNHASKFCVRAMDFNNDGKLDLFVSGRVDPWSYPRPVSSFVFRNDSDKDHVKFTDVTDSVAPDLGRIGMVCDALFTDFDGDGQTDLIVVGEWMPVTFLKNVKGRFRNVTAATGMGGGGVGGAGGVGGGGGLNGWWSSIVAGDFRHTGRTDYIVGNLGLNSLYKASDQYPVYITAGDLEGNGRYVGVPSLFLPDRDGVKKEFPAEGRDDMTRQLNSLKRRYPDYKSYAVATMEEVLTPEQRKGALRLKANMLQSCFFRNDGGGRFTVIPLPEAAQVSVINGMVADDFDGDGNLDVLINGNDFGTEIGIGRYDAFNGLVLKGDGAGGFRALSGMESGVCIPGNGRALVKLRGGRGLGAGKYMIAASQNKNDLKLYALNRKAEGIAFRADDVSAMIRFRNGKVQKEEAYYGTSFLSQSARFISVSPGVESVEIVNTKGIRRTVKMQE